ncbi:MAG: AlpA family phage regulatory protein [Micropepsaceae bacterium]
MNVLSEKRFLRWTQIARRIPLCRHQVNNLVKAGKFPEPIRLGPNSVAWSEQEIEQWLADRMAARMRAPQRKDEAKPAA